MENEQKPKPKPKLGFTIIKNDPTDGHKGFGIGSLSLENVSPVVIDVEDEVATIEIGAMHARSPLERGIKFLPEREESANGKVYWLVWVTIDYKEEGPYYAGVTACEMVIDRPIRRGYKNFIEHMNKLDKSMKGSIMVDHIDDTAKRVLAEFLQEHNMELWNRSGAELHEGLRIQTS